MSCEEDLVVFEQRCPVCSKFNVEVYEKRVKGLPVSGGVVESYVFKELLSGSGSFKRLIIDDKTFISCPKCGVVLDAAICEQEMSYETARRKYSVHKTIKEL